MPKSKRNRLVTLSKTKKKGREQKESVVTAVRGCMDEYSSIYAFAFENMRNQSFKAFKDQLKGTSRFFLGSNKVLQIALGKTAADEHRDGLHKLSELVKGNRGLFFTNLPKEEASRIFEEYEERDFVRTGNLATETVELPEGPLEMFPHDMEPFLRKQGMPVRLNRGVVELVSDFTVCREGEHISPEASRILRLLGKKMAAFKMYLIARWAPDEFELLMDPADVDKIGADEGQELEEDGPVDLNALLSS
eukprot:TRINITY_DN2273_c0_g1_i1.p1 TRINITY_DN2273_c0_g1~~TRINITY_DN2273_c0_g1_i1.p1  ORF type:complete len:249 (+),score=67.04 TRINITY_DN2273_c0_g1_i1:182-928(+)